MISIGSKVGSNVLRQCHTVRQVAGGRPPVSSATRRRLTSGKKKQEPSQMPSPAEAKRKYLESLEKTKKGEAVVDPMKRMAELNLEIEQVRAEAVAKLDKELNKSVYRKLTDPLRRYKHSLINVGAVTLSYILAHNLFVKSRAHKETTAELEAAEADIVELKGVLQSLLYADTLKSIASTCVEEMQSEAQDAHQRGWFSPSKTRNVQDADEMEQVMSKVLQQELERRIGDHALDEEQKKERDLKNVWKESQKEVEALNENPERMLMAALEEATAEPSSSDDNDKPKQRRVFSM